ncbi:AAA family ATPase [Bacillus sp. Cr_A10]|uniref:AAA family ATPase n=1 Tax=Bacillus sp. Cr_A10 TaxID=3033993 RepID=UPI0023DBC800|nr:AAA family ATPase [Bacillus sp. Cr_A10]MDF2066530.1 AAA family ATPase [Bacillus sp. Cr_A10]
MRFLIMTVGTTHSGKTTFANLLEKRLINSVVIDQDAQGEFLEKHYPSLLPEKGPKILKFALSQTIVDFAINKTDNHIILCNSNRQKQSRLNLIEKFKKEGFQTLIVNFDLPLEILKDRIINSHRDTTILRNVSNYDQVLDIQLKQTKIKGFIPPTEDEVDHLFTITNETDIKTVIEKIINLV